MRPRPDLPKARVKLGSPPLPPHKPPAAVRQSFFALPGGASKPGQAGTADIAVPGASPQRTGLQRAQAASPPRQHGDACKVTRGALHSPGSATGKESQQSSAADQPAASGRHRRAASASAAEDLGLQTGMSLLDTQNLDELAEREEQPAFHRTMSMLSTVGLLGTLACPAAGRDSDSEDSHSTSEDSADSNADSGRDDITMTGPYSSLGAASTAARLAGEKERLQARSAAVALEATRQRREASAARTGADARPVFMKALQILAGGASEVATAAAATSECAEPVQAMRLPDKATPATSEAPAVDGAPAAVRQDAATGSCAQPGLPSFAPDEAPTSAPAAEQGKKEVSPGYRPRRLSTAAKPFVPGAPSSAGKPGPGRLLASVPWHSKEAPWMQNAHSTTTAASSKAGIALQKPAAPPLKGRASQQPAETSSRGHSSLATVVATSHGHAESSKPALDALPGALSNADELVSTVADAEPSHDPRQKLDFGETTSKVRLP